MADTLPSLSTDQVAAFVELARAGSLRAAAGELHVTEQGVRNRLLALEQRLGRALYHKARGPRRASPLTEHGRRFLPHAVAFLEHARSLRDALDAAPAEREVRAAASEYLSYHLLIDVVKRFHKAHPSIRVRLSTRTEREIEAELLEGGRISLGIAAPYAPDSDLAYTHLFEMGWSAITPPRHPLLRRRRVRMEHLAGLPLILFEPGSTGRSHVMDAFTTRGLSPRVEMEMTSTPVIVRAVEAGLGVSIVPLLAGGQVTRGRRVGIRSLGRQVAPIRSGILTRRGDPLPHAARMFIDFLSADPLIASA